VIHGVGGDEGERPSTTDAARAKMGVLRLAFEPEASGEQSGADSKAGEYLSYRPEMVSW